MRHLRRIIQLSSIICVLSCVGLAVGVISDMEWLLALCGLAATLSIIVMPAGIIVAFCTRKFATGLAGIGYLALSLTVGFFTFILIGAGQHHPPRRDAVACDTDSVEVVADSLEMAE